MNLFDRPGVEPNLAAMDHSPGFLKLVNEAKNYVEEVTVAETRARLGTNPQVVLMDVREDNEWIAGHAAEAVHLGKGILERDLEKLYPDPNTEIIMYCGGGFRSALTADAAQKLGYRKVYSLIGGYKALAAADWPMKREG
jgi:rhodanese-related sulfurtransferase